MKHLNTIMRAIVCAVAVTLTVGATAQSPYRQPRRVVVTHYNGGPRDMRGMPGDYYSPMTPRPYFGLRIGLNEASVRSDADALDGKGLKSGLNIGVTVGMPLGYYSPLALETGLFYSQKGGKSDGKLTADGGTGKFTYDLNYLEVPLVLRYSHFLNNEVRIEPFAGPYVAVGVAGEVKNYDQRRAFSSYDEGYFNRFDAGITLGCAVGMGPAYAQVGYDIGLSNVGQDSFDDTHTGCLTLSVGVNF